MASWLQLHHSGAATPSGLKAACGLKNPSLISHFVAGSDEICSPNFIDATEKSASMHAAWIPYLISLNRCPGCRTILYLKEGKGL